LRELRTRRGASQEAFAFECGLNRQFISLLELGQREPSIETIYKVAAGLDMEGSELLAQVESWMRAPKRRTRS
jgi:transcriptional regulator with XRE-family HTH domain